MSRVIGWGVAFVAGVGVWLAVLWLLDAFFAAALVGAGAGWAIAELVHRHRTRQLNRRWAAITRALRQEDPS